MKIRIELGNLIILTKMSNRFCIYHKHFISMINDINISYISPLVSIFAQTKFGSKLVYDYVLETSHVRFSAVYYIRNFLFEIQ